MTFRIQMDNFAGHLAELQPDNLIDITVGNVEEINSDTFAVVSVSISAKPSEMSSDKLNELYSEWKPAQGLEENKVFSASINTELNECKLRNNVCSKNANCIDQHILYRYSWHNFVTVAKFDDYLYIFVPHVRVVQLLTFILTARNKCIVIGSLCKAIKHVVHNVTCKKMFAFEHINRCLNFNMLD